MVDFLDVRDPSEAFVNAIEQGLADPEDWLYMFSDDTYDYFKHCDTRDFIKYPYK